MRAGTELADRYRLERLLGRGGMGEVWRSIDQRLDRPVAVKLLLANLLGDDRISHEALSRFRREGKAAARLNHSNITAVYDLGEHRDIRNGIELTFPFLVLELLEGCDLNSVLDDHPGGLPLGRVLDYGIQAADALAAAHAAGIVHRDIKPANLMLLDNGTIKVCDFGIARLHGATAGLSATGGVIGTLLYMPPEQLDGHEVDHRADLYALGATLYHLLTGQHVFPATDLRALAYMHATKTPAPPSALRPSISPDVDRLITALLAKLPDQRPTSAADTAASLRTARSASEHRTAKAKLITRSITDPDRARDLLAEAERIAHDIFFGDAATLREIAEVAAEHDPVEAERIARSITDPDNAAHALLNIAEAVARHDRDRARDLLAEAESVARSITVLQWQLDTLCDIAKVAAEHDPAEAERIARSITDPDSQARALREIAKVVAQHDRDHARDLLTEAERIARSITYPFSQSLALLRVAEVVAQHDRDHARDLLTEAERIARSITDPETTAHALFDIAKAVRQHDRDYARALLAEAEHLARSVTDPLDPHLLLCWITEAMAWHDPTEAERLVHSRALPPRCGHLEYRMMEIRRQGVPRGDEVVSAGVQGGCRRFVPVRSGTDAGLGG
ncbi:protein kinase domain-containing protein [Streptosporangium sp. NBC_01756]|uniref:protein kinase domain-containing protein n=1 Tax=Streptosporangium sp. NBC_01756 TaxID=2975950 RepID=UPI002DDA2170|nr:protein kinase [Streptosporangium sp. NBC_01756]WSC89455.1 protein kinase [Streptosporangium sp. NBC_01756]